MKVEHGRKRILGKGFAGFTWALGLLLAVLLAVLWSGLALAQGQKSTVEEILDILKTKGIINETEHQELMKRAKAEEAARVEQAVKAAQVEKNAKAAQVEKAEAPNTLRAYYKEGISLETADRAFQLKIGGRLNIDCALFMPDENVESFFGEDFGHGVEFRRARLCFEGTLYDRFEFKSEFDFAGGDVDFDDVWLGMKGIPYVGKIRVGHMKEPFSLEYMTKFRYTTFMEMALPNALVPQRNTGIAILNQAYGERLTWGVGGFLETDAFGDGFSDTDDYNVTARLTGLPWYADDGRHLVHLGFSYSHKFRNEDDGTTIRYRQVPEAHLSPVYYLDTGDFLLDAVDVVNPEFALVCGPFSLQAEYTHAFVDSSEFDNPDFWGYYVYGSYFITGEYRPYKEGAFQRVRPRKNFLQDGGWGAWEVALRYSYLDLADNNLGEVNEEGGKLSDVTFGLNWYLNATIKLMFNYIFADLDDVGDTHILESRFHLEF
jgi:phosphate-selective porin OprO/OprP